MAAVDNAVINAKLDFGTLARRLSFEIARGDECANCVGGETIQTPLGEQPEHLGIMICDIFKPAGAIVVKN